MNDPSMKKIQFIFATFAGILFSVGLHAQTSPVVVSKAVSDNGDGSYTLTLKSYLTGKLYDDSATVPSDIVLLMDVSQDLSATISTQKLYRPVSKPVTTATKPVTAIAVPTITTTTKNKATATAKNPTKVTRAMTKLDRTVETGPKNWTYNNTTANAAGTKDYSHYYRDDNGDYYVVHKSKTATTSTGASTNRVLWYVDKNGDTWYLTTQGVSPTPRDVTSDTGTIWNGKLYTGWTYLTHSSTDSNGNKTYQCYGFHYGNANATNADQRYYKHTDGEYYPVRLRNDMPDANGGNECRVAYVIIDGVTYYLHGEKLDSDPDGYDHTMTSDYRAIYFAPLYYSKSDGGGWWYDNIVAATASGGHYYLYTDGKYYPVQKATETVDGATTYQAFIMTPDGKRYLYGTNHLSATPCPFETSGTVPMFFGDLYTGGWCTNNITDGTTGTAHYYLHSDGEYYPVREITSGSHQAYIETLQGKFYFNGNGLSDTPDTPYDFSTTKYVALYFGTLYTMTGWTSATIKEATVEGGHFYLHTDGHYYPVLKETLTSPTTTYQAYVMLAGPDGNLTVKKYLWAHTIHDEPCPYSAATTTVFYYGKLYSGGSTQYNTTALTSIYQYTDGEYYPIEKKTVTVNVNGTNKTTYQLAISTPDGIRYLWGHGIHTDPYPYSWATKSSLFFEPLYKGGWTYNSITAQGTAGGEFYRHNGKYYKVLRMTDSNPTKYQLFFVTPEGETWYLYGTSASRTKYPYATTKDMGIYYGPLYKGGWTYSNTTAGTATTGQFALYNGQYWPVKKSKNTVTHSGTTYSSNCRHLYIEPTGVGKLYLIGSDFTPNTVWYNRNDGSSLYLESLYELKAYSKYEGLKAAVNSFIDEIVQKTQQTGLQHRIALVQYGLANWGASGGVADVDHPHLQKTTSSTAARKAAVLVDFLPASDSQLHNTINTALTTAADATTAHGFGLSIANGLFKREGGNDNVDYDGNGIVNLATSDPYEKAKLTGDDKTNYSSRPKIVIVIGDGVENPSSSEQTAIEQATLLKTQSQNVAVYYVQVSENGAITSFQQSVATDAQHCYHVELYDEDLTDALLTISQQIGGEVVNLGVNTIVQDVVTSDFKIRDGAQVQVFTSDYAIPEDGNSPVFSDQWSAFAGNVVQTENADGTTTIQVTGFDFSENWVGLRSVEEGYGGQQLIVQIPIEPKEGIVGGNNVPTNTADSKFMKENGDQLALYPIQYVSGIPMTIIISKAGLRTGDSAVFNIKRKLYGAANFDSTPFMRVILTGNAAGTAVTAELKNLDPAYSYLVEEGPWSWTYTPTVNSISTETQTENPFEFGNTARTNIVYDYGEREAKNIF